MNKITDKDLANRGVKGLPDVPGLTTEEMQRKLEEIAREILVPKVNEIIDNLIAVNSNLNLLPSNRYMSEWIIVNGNSWATTQLDFFLNEKSIITCLCQQTGARRYENYIVNASGSGSIVETYNEESFQIAVRYIIYY